MPDDRPYTTPYFTPHCQHCGASPVGCRCPEGYDDRPTLPHEGATVLASVEVRSALTGAIHGIAADSEWEEADLIIWGLRKKGFHIVRVEVPHAE